MQGARKHKLGGSGRLFGLQDPIVWILFSFLAEFLHFTALLSSLSHPTMLQMCAFKYNWHWSYTYLTGLVCLLQGFLHLCMLERIPVKYLYRAPKHNLGWVHQVGCKTPGLCTDIFLSSFEISGWDCGSCDPGAREGGRSCKSCGLPEVSHPAGAWYQPVLSLKNRLLSLVTQHCMEATII